MAGDQILRELTRLVSETIRKDDIFGRFGGEEFLILFPQTPLAQALAVAEKIRGAIESHPFSFACNQPLGFVSVSGGVAECPRDGLDSTRLLAAADEALYRAKHGGRNRVFAAERFDLSEGEVVLFERDGRT
jgi:diguanylate cyclase (GGDEF)-like protein